MSFSFNDIKYGWKIITGVVITGATIFVADNTRQQILQRDTIQPILGTHERCLSAGVAPLEFVRSWYSNAYDGTNAVLYTNIVTNAIGWRVDRGMLVDLDAKIEELAPYFADTNTVYDGSPEIVMNTFTGLLTSLDIGDHTNFTSYEWYVSQDDLKERYKVLNALKYTKPANFTKSFTARGAAAGNWTNWSEVKQSVDNNLADNFNDYYHGVEGEYGTMGIVCHYDDEDPTVRVNFYARKVIMTNASVCWTNNNSLSGVAKFYVSLTNFACPPSFRDSPRARETFDFLAAPYDDNGSGSVIDGRYYSWISAEITNNGVFNESVVPCTTATWCDEPFPETGAGYGQQCRGYSAASFRGFIYRDSLVVVNWSSSTNGFQYCTNALP